MLISYLALQIVRQPLIFLRRWYIDATEKFWAAVAEHAAAIDRVFAIKIMLRTITQPLYGDYTIVGRILGPIFRLSRACIAFVVFAIYFAIAAAIWFSWALILPYLIFIAIRN